MAKRIAELERENEFLKKAYYLACQGALTPEIYPVIYHFGQARSRKPTVPGDHDVQTA